MVATLRSEPEGVRVVTMTLFCFLLGGWLYTLVRVWTASCWML